MKDGYHSLCRCRAALVSPQKYKRRSRTLIAFELTAWSRARATFLAKKREGANCPGELKGVGRAEMSLEQEISKI